jgi:hypothetical protein
LESYYAKQGEEFTISFDEIVLEGPAEGDTHSTLAYQITYRNQTFTNYALLNGISKFIASTDWDNQVSVMEGIIAEFQNDVEYDTFISEIIDTSSEFGVKIEFSITTEEGVISGELEKKYDKKTGMVKSDYTYSKWSQDGIEYESESKVKHKGGGNKSSIIPGFDFYIFFTSLIIIIIPLIWNKRP